MKCNHQRQAEEGEDSSSYSEQVALRLRLFANAAETYEHYSYEEEGEGGEVLGW